MIYTDLTKKAMQIAYDAHYGQVDRGNTPYICHPLHLADQMDTEEETLTALAPLIRGNVEHTLEFGAVQALTGPVSSRLPCPVSVLRTGLTITHAILQG